MAVSDEQDFVRQHEEEIRRCQEEGIACSYGICDECILMIGSRKSNEEE